MYTCPCTSTLTMYASGAQLDDVKTSDVIFFCASKNIGESLDMFALHMEMYGHVCVDLLADINCYLTNLLLKKAVDQWPVAYSPKKSSRIHSHI